MKRVSKILSVVLSLMLIIYLAGFEVSAEEETNVGTQNTQTETSVSKADQTEDKLNANGTIETEEPKEDTSQKIDSVQQDKDNTDEEESKSITDDKDITDDSDTVQIDKNAAYISELEAVTEQKDTVKLTWNIEDSEDIISGFDVELYTDENLDENTKKFEQSVEKESQEQKEAEATIKGLSAGIVYYAAVTPYNIDENEEKEEAEAAVIKVMTLSAPTLSAKAAEGTVTLNWSAVTGVEAYEVYQISGTSKIKLATVKGQTTYTHKVSKNNTTYKYVVTATAAGSDSVDSNEVSATPRTAKPGKVTNLSGMDGEKRSILTWSKVSNATSYYVYRYNSSKKRWDMIKQVTGTSYTNKSLTAGKTYKYRVAAVRTKLGETVRGDVTSTLSVSVKKTPGTKVYPMKYKATVRSKAPCFTSKNGKKRVRYLKKGTKVTTIDSSNGRYKIKLSNGKTYWVAKGRLKITASVWTSKDYSTQIKTNFVNSRGYKSSSKYLIWISQYTQRVMIFEGKKGKWKMIRSCRCATGTYLHKTPKGTFKITYKEKGWFYKTTYEKPIVHFKGANSFHSRIKNYKGGYADPTIGRPKSKGCVRLYDEDINFIYKNCPKGTTVVSY